jgi:signal transduction histidine kinase
MPIRITVLIACLGFLAITIALGLFTRAQEGRLGTLAMSVYDNALVGVNYARKVQTDFVRFAAARRDADAGAADPAVEAQLTALLDDLDVAIERSMSDKGRAAAQAIRAEIAALRAPPSATARGASLAAIDAELGKLVQKYAADGFLYRIRAEEIVDESDRALIFGLAIAVVLATAIALVLGATIVPPVKRAAGIAMAIAEGRLDNAITWKGRSETAQLLAALATMQSSIAADIRRIEAMRAAEAAQTAELRSAQEELIKKERLSALGQLTATVAHELRNPLSAIKNTLFALRELSAAKSISLERPLSRVDRAVERCNRIISDLLDYTRARELQTETREFDTWLAEIIDELPAATEFAMSRDLGAAGMAVCFDPERFRRVVVNLVDNAAQAMIGPPAWPETKLIVVRTRAIGGQLEMVVDDSGPGIAPDILGRIFDPLFSTKSFGTGLGLPTVKQIVEQHRGTIAVDSEVGRGTRMSVRLPLAAVDEKAA